MDPESAESATYYGNMVFSDYYGNSNVCDCGDHMCGEQTYPELHVVSNEELADMVREVICKKDLLSWLQTYSRSTEPTDPVIYDIFNDPQIFANLNGRSTVELVMLAQRRQFP
jgi:hypothetical protein